MHITTTALQDATERVSRYLQMQLVVNLCYGAVAGVTLRLIGVPHPFLWAVLTCILRFVPYIGIMMAAAGPLLLAGAVSPRWTELIWTVIMFCVLELVSGNFVEPLLYGASTGISAIAVLLAAVFWTFLWGLPGLLLSTPLTVCLIVIGRQVPRLHYLEVLLGERTGLPVSEQFYQRMLASRPADARALLEAAMKKRSRAEVYDTVLIPALTMVEEALHSQEMTPVRAEEILQSMEDVVEEMASEAVSGLGTQAEHAPPVMCIPARGLADEIACQLAQQLFAANLTVHIAAADSSLTSIQEAMARLQPKVICVVGVPPRAVRHIRMRCHQIRGRFPGTIMVACTLSDQTDLSSLRSRIPTRDAQHVVSSLQLMGDYLMSVLHPAVALEAGATTASALEKAASVEDVAAAKRTDPFDGPADGIFARLVTDLARSYDAPMVMILATDGKEHFWEAQCGLPEDALAVSRSEGEKCICSTVAFSDTILLVPDINEQEQFAGDSFLMKYGVRFCAAAPLRDRDGVMFGSLCVLDTRPRQITEIQRDALISIADLVMMEIDLQEPAHSGASREEISL